jgi:arylsulfatase A-like enzyme
MHILLIEIRSCHIGYLGCYGNDWLRTPALDSIASAGMVFDAHYADVIGVHRGQPAWVTLHGNDRPISLESWLSAKQGEAHWVGAWAGATCRSLDEIAPALRRMAARRGPCVMAIGISDLELSGDSRPTMTEVAEDELLPADVDAGPEILSQGDASLLQVREKYASGVEAADQWFAKLLEQLHITRLLDKAALIITSDQGASLGEHAPAGTSPNYPYEEVSHLPLIIRVPEDEHAGTRLSILTQASDLSGAFLAILDGHHDDLLNLCRKKDTTREYVRTVQISEAGLQTVAVRTAEWAFLTDLNSGSATAELYRKPEDRWEINNVAQHHPDLLPRLEGLARALPLQ